MDPGGILTAYKCPRTQGSSFCLESFLQESKETSCPSLNDNRTAVAYLLKMGGGGGGTRSLVLVGIAQELWEYALRKEISLTAEYLPGGLNHKADWQSRHLRDSRNWKLNPKVFHSIDQLWGPLTIDLFADRINTQIREFVPRPLCSGDRCLSDPLVEPEGLLLCSFLTDLSLPGKDKEGSGNNVFDSTNLACTGMVPSPVGDVLQTFDSTSPAEGSITLSQPSATPSGSEGPPEISGLDD